LEAFVELLRGVPPDTGMAFVLVQHLDPTHPSYLTEAIGRATTLPVEEIRDGVVVQPNHVYVIPSNADLGILGGALALLPRSAERPHLPIDFFFRALAKDRGGQAIGVVLSGTGTDGSEGLRAIKAEDGVTFAQDARSAKFSGMPEAAIKTGIVDFALPIPELAQELTRIGRHPFIRAREGEVLSSPTDDKELRKVLILLRNARGVEFGEYKLTSVRRRVARRMALHRVTALQEYVRLLTDDRAEVETLFEDILIHVTSFFRDGDAFEKLKERVFPEILKQKRSGGTIRIWCAGCSTGEEAYSLVIALLEFLAQENASDVPIQLFGTDLSEKAIEQARAGLYPEGIIRDVSPDRLSRFFTKMEAGGYQISKFVRERCAFVQQDLASDPPFSKLDLVSCRNVLIYFGRELQQRVLAAFHFALNEPGFLLLGHAENLAEGMQLFAAVDKTYKIFARSAGKSTLRLVPTRDIVRVAAAPPANLRVSAAVAPDLVRRAEGLLLDQFAPPGVIINERMEILHFRGHTGPFLEPTPGQPQHDLLKMARRGLMPDLRIAISAATKTKSTVRREAHVAQDDGSTRLCELVVVPVASPPEARERVFAVLFGEAPRRPPPEKEAPRPAGPRTAARTRLDERRAERLEAELKANKEYLQSIIEDHQRTNEELVSTNEELVSTNEELQSLNEELETAKEELQSTNEELSTLNEELQTRNLELNAVNSDLVNVLGAAEVPIVIVDATRRIRRFTPQARPLLNLIASDVGRSIDDIRPSLAVENLDQKIAKVVDTVTVHEEEARGRDGRWYRLQIRPYTTIDRKIDGAVLSIIDIDALKRALGAAEWARDYATATVEAIQTPILVLDDTLGILSANAAFHETYGVPPGESEARGLYDVMNGAWDLPALRSALDRVREKDARFERVEAEAEIPRLGRRTVSLSGRTIPTPTGGRMIVLAAEDITERRRAEAERTRLLEDTEAAKASAEKANRTKDIFLATLSHELRTPLSTLLMQSQLLQRGPVGEAKLKRAAGAIERATRAQAQLVEDLLDVSRIVAGKLKMEPKPTNLGSVVRAALETLGPSAERKQLDVETHLDERLAPVFGDPERLQQIVLNLLTNAFKFTPERGRVIVTVDSVDGQARVRVTDSGIGIEPDFLPQIFDRFSQEDRLQTRSHGGLGLGLAIVRHLVEAHGGSVQAESEGKGKGATFTVRLPLMKETGKLAAEQGASARRTSDHPVTSIDGVRVLVVEDDQGTREALTEMLRLSGADVRPAESAARAMILQKEFRPQLLVCDIAMPQEDGYSLLGRIRALGPERGGNVPAVALTALAGEEDQRSAFAAGFQVHMAKPVDVDRLLAALVGLLNEPTSISMHAGPAPR